MKPLSGAILAASALFSLAYAAKPWDGAYTAFKGSYLIYSGDLGEEAAPTTTDRKAALMLEGAVARDLFEAIGPDVKDACGSGTGLRLRQRGDLDCTFDKAAKPSPYVCHIGINLKTGKSMIGAIC